MRFGFYLPTHGAGTDREGIEALVTRGETHGFDSVMVADHSVFPVQVESAYPYTVSGVFPGGGDALDQLTLMAFVAAKTSRMRIVSSIMIVPQRNPVLAAKAIATIDVLSGGRVTVGVGVGWLREEFEALDAHHFEQGGAVTDEYLRIFKNLWTEHPSAFEGEFYRYDPLHRLPKAAAAYAPSDLDRRVSLIRSRSRWSARSPWSPRSLRPPEIETVAP